MLTFPARLPLSDDYCILHTWPRPQRSTGRFGEAMQAPSAIWVRKNCRFAQGAEQKSPQFSEWALVLQPQETTNQKCNQYSWKYVLPCQQTRLGHALITECKCQARAQWLIKTSVWFKDQPPPQAATEVNPPVCYPSPCIQSGILLLSNAKTHFTANDF